MTQPPKLAIDIWSDVMCPWCVIGWGNLKTALDQLKGEIEAEIRWHAFELNPDMAKEGEDRIAYFSKKYGRTTEQSKEILDRMRAAARAAGVSLDYEGEEPAPDMMMWNTFDAHKLLKFAADSHGAARQTQLKLALFKAHFNDRRRIGEREILLDVAGEAGLDREAAAAALDNEDLSREIRGEERAAMEMQMTGVPTMIVAGRFMIRGAQPPEALIETLRRAAESTSSLHA
ncbi:DsbA family oxidoreductase [Fulvimarina sp. MAC3]|uniref:DsbA family oxidoreductase n=1 Tax=Fulvimarina sp. MAC3 TaxID=3148887 RepID=UPI0031FC3484